MNQPTEKITDIRDLVDRAITAKVKEMDARHGRAISFLDYRTVARFGNVTYVSLERQDGRPSTFGFNEGHMWGVSNDQVFIPEIGRMANLAVVSLSGMPDSLLRRLAVVSSMPCQEVSTQVNLSEDQVDDALRWATSPQLAQDELVRLCAVQPQEVDAITVELRRLDETTARYYEDVERLKMMRSQPYTDPNGTFV